MKLADLAGKVVGTILEMLSRNSEGQFVYPWKRLGFHYQAENGRPYEGGNQFILAIETLVKGYTENRWATYKTWERLGAQVRKGEKGTALFKYQPTWSCRTCADPGPDSGCDHCRRKMFVRGFYVFNADQVDNAPPLREPDHDPIDLDSRLEAFVDSTGAKVGFGGDRAFYRPSTDSITLPPVRSFTSTRGYYSTLFHELVHWTGHPSRLDRGGKAKRFGDIEYSTEELVAEIGAAMLCAHFGVEAEPHPNHAAYVKGYLEAVASEPTRLLDAARDAQKAVAFLLATAGGQLDHPDEASTSEDVVSYRELTTVHA